LHDVPDGDFFRRHSGSMIADGPSDSTEKQQTMASSGIPPSETLLEDFQAIKTGDNPLLATMDISFYPCQVQTLG